MANNNETDDANTNELHMRLSEMDSKDLQHRLERGLFADFAIDAARAELLRRGLTPAEPTVNDSPSTSASYDMVIIERRLSPTEAHVLRAALEADGVHATVDDFNSAYTLGYLAYALDGVRVRVSENHLERALKILADVKAGRHALHEDEDPASPDPCVLEQRILAFTQDKRLSKDWHQTPPPFIGFMWSAFIFGPMWFCYRKLYKTGFALLALELFFIASGIHTSAIIWPLAIISLRLTIACTARSMYYAHTRSAIQKFAKTGNDERKVQFMLQRHGGVNFVAGLGALMTHRLFGYLL